MTSPTRYFSAFALYYLLISGFYFILSFMGGSIAFDLSEQSIPASSVPLYVALALTGIIPLSPEVVNLERRLRGFVHNVVGVPRIVGQLFSEVKASEVNSDSLNKVLDDVFAERSAAIRESSQRIGSIAGEVCVRWVRSHFLLNALLDNNRLVETLGRPAARRILRRRKRIEAVREDLHRVDGKLLDLMNAPLDSEGAGDILTNDMIAKIKSFWLEQKENINEVYVALVRALSTGIVSSGYGYRRSIRALNELGFNIKLDIDYEELYEKTLKGLLVLMMFGALTTVGSAFVIALFGFDSKLGPTDISSCVSFILTATIPYFFSIYLFMILMRPSILMGQWRITNAIIPGAVSIIVAYILGILIVYCRYLFDSGSVIESFGNLSLDDLLNALIATIPASGLVVAYGWAIEIRDFADDEQHSLSWSMLRCSAFALIVPIVFASLIAMQTHFGDRSQSFGEFLSSEILGYSLLFLISFSYTAAFFIGFGVSHVIVRGSRDLSSAT